MGERSLPDGSATSALKFSSEEPLSIIREGSGYWRYIPTEAGVRFLTWYDYQTRFGAPGRLFDRLIFKPLLGWATAWSFDRLRLWIEDGIDPRTTTQLALVHAVARVALAVVFAYQGLVPKLLYFHPDEVALITAMGVPPEVTPQALTALGAVELVMAGLLILNWTRSWPARVCLIAMPLVIAGVAVSAPTYFRAAFNPFTLNASVAALAAIDLLVVGRVPSARRCRRRPITEVS